jgi:hypothetical protein
VEEPTIRFGDRLRVVETLATWQEGDAHRVGVCLGWRGSLVRVLFEDREPAQEKFLDPVVLKRVETTADGTAGRRPRWRRRRA